jgi:hypothetical protein
MIPNAAAICGLLFVEPRLLGLSSNEWAGCSTRSHLWAPIGSRKAGRAGCEPEGPSISNMTCFREQGLKYLRSIYIQTGESSIFKRANLAPTGHTNLSDKSSYIYANAYSHKTLSFAAIACATDLQGFKLDQRPLPATRMIELESQEAVETMRVATVAHVSASRGLRLLAFAASLAFAALVVVTNRQDHWGVTATFTMFQVWVYV